MYAWVEIILVYIIIITLKGNLKRGVLLLRIIYLRDFNKSRIFALQTSNRRIFGHLAMFSV